MQINDLFKIIDDQDLEDVSKEDKKLMYNTVRTLLKYYKEMGFENDVYDIWCNVDKINGYLQAKKVKLDADLDEILAIDEVAEYCEDQHCDEAVEETEYEPVPQNINIKIDVPQTPWIVFYLVVVNTLTLGMNAYTMFKTLQG